MIQLKMTIYNMILTQKQQKYQYYHKGKIDQYEYLTDEETLLSDHQKRKVKQAKEAIPFQEKL